MDNTLTIKPLKFFFKAYPRIILGTKTTIFSKSITNCEINAKFQLNLMFCVNKHNHSSP